ncbi:putative Ig domain-containing protein, partial [Alphaproteobacteria bacterium]|nr:putative Ig domain-containing protein [Alphaproteobacteria bacterium]
LTDQHVGKSISVNLLDANGNTQLAPMQLDEIVVNVNDLPTGGIFIEGELKQGTAAKVNTESLNDEDGLGALSFEWFSDGILIGNETSSSLELTQDLAGFLISVKVSYTDKNGTPEIVEAIAASPVIDVSYPTSGNVVLNLTEPEQFEMLTADISDIYDDDGISTMTYQWLLDGAPIEEETTLNYRIKEADLGSDISFAVTVLDGEGNSSTVNSVAASILEGTSPLSLNLDLESENVVGSSGSVTFVVQSSHASILSDYSKVEIDNGEIQEVLTAEDGSSHTISIDLFDLQKPVSLSILDGAFTEETYGISNKNSLNGKAYSLAEFALPENIYDVGGQYSNPGHSGNFRYDLFDKVTHDGSNYYYLSHSENTRPYRGFSQVDPEISNGTFNLSLPTKVELEELFNSSTLDGTNSGNSISNNDVWWDQDYWYKESGSGNYDSSMWLARGSRDSFSDGTINFDKADAATVYKVEASQFVQLFQSGSQKFLEGTPNTLTIVRSGLADKDLKIEIEVSGIDDIASQLIFANPDVEVMQDSLIVTLSAGDNILPLTYQTSNLSNGLEINFELIDAGDVATLETQYDISHRLEYVAISESILVQSFNDIVSGGPQIIGDFVEGSELSVDTSSISTIADGEVTYQYNWLKNGELIASTNTYSIEPEDVGSLLGLEVSINTQMGDVTKTLEAASLVAPLNLEILEFEQNEDASINLGDIFPGGKNLTFSAEGLPSSLSLEESTGEITGSLKNIDVGGHSINLFASDQQGNATSTSFSLLVNNVNDAPKFKVEDDYFFGSEDQDVTFTIPIREYADDIDHDVSNEGLRYTLESGPGWLVMSPDGFLLGMARNDYVGTHSLIIKVTDKAGAFDTKTFLLTINNVNDAPTLEAISDESTDEDAPFEYQLTATDIDMDVVDNETLTYEAVEKPGWMTVSSSGLITGTPENDDVGEHTITVKVTDSIGESDTKTFTLLVNNTNDVPALGHVSEDLLSVNEDDALEIQLAVSDVDTGDSHVFKIIDSTIGLDLYVSDDGVLSGLPDNENVGENFFIIEVEDAEGLTDSKMFTLTVNNTNDAPYFFTDPFTSIPLVTDQDSPFSYTLVAADDDLPEFDTLTFSTLNQLPDGLSLSSDGVLSGIPTNDAVGVHEIYVDVKDLAGQTASQRLSLTVNNVNDAPVLEVILNSSTEEDAAFEYQLTASDIDLNVSNETLTYEAETTPDWMSVSSSGLITGTPENDDVDEHTVTVKVTDSAGVSDKKTFTLTVNNTNDAPVIDVDDTDGALTDALDGSSFSHQLGVADVDVGDAHTYSMSSAGDISWLSLDAATGLLTGSPDDEQVGVYNIAFSVEDAAGVVSTSDAISLTVQNVNDPVYIDEGQLGSFRANKEGIYQISTSDEDLADSYTFTADDLPEWLSLDPATGILTGTPTRADDGIYTIDVTVTDGGGLSDTDTISIKSTSYQYASLGSGSDLYMGEDVQDHISTGGGDDKIMSAGGDDVVVVEAAYVSDETVTLTITVEKGEDGTEKFFINGAETPELGIVTGQTYIFDLSDPSLTGSPFSIGIFGDAEGEEPSYEVEEEYAGRYALLPGEHINRYGEEGQEGAYVSVEIPHNFNDYFWNTLYYSNGTVAGMGGYTSTTVGSSSPDNVEVDTGEGDDRVVVEDGWSGTLLVKNG